jgi:hypothetical protein
MRIAQTPSKAAPDDPATGRQQRIATRSMEIAAQTIMEVAEFIRTNPSDMGPVRYEQERERISSKLQRNMAGLISEASEYDE